MHVKILHVCNFWLKYKKEDMKIGIPLEETEEGKHTMLAPNFHSCSYVGIYDMKCDRLEVVETHAQKNAFFELIKSQNIKAVITPSFKVMSLNLFCENAIALYHSEGLELQHNIEGLKNNTLSKYTIWGV